MECVVKWPIIQRVPHISKRLVCCPWQRIYSVGLEPLSPDSRANVSLDCAAMEKDFYQLRPKTVSGDGWLRKLNISATYCLFRKMQANMQA